MASIIHGAIGVGERRVPRVSNLVTPEQSTPAWHVSVGLSFGLGWAGLLLLAGLVWIALPCAGRPGLDLSNSVQSDGGHVYMWVTACQEPINYI